MKKHFPGRIEHKHFLALKWRFICGRALKVLRDVKE
jgi:hypothetical protein